MTINKRLRQRAESKRMAVAAEDICMKLSVAILADVFGFGDKRIQKFMDSYQMLSESLGVGTDSIEEIERNLKKRFNI